MYQLFGGNGILFAPDSHRWKTPNRVHSSLVGTKQPVPLYNMLGRPIFPELPVVRLVLSGAWYNLCGL